jgi:hypothetical protein
MHRALSTPTRHSLSPSGRQGCDKNRCHFSKLNWKFAALNCNVDDDTFDRDATTFDNMDHVAVVIHIYPFNSLSRELRRN